MVKIKNNDATLSIKVTEIILKETTLAPTEELELDANTLEVHVETIP